MKKLFSIITLAFGLLLMAGCNDLLDVPPVRDIPEESVFERTRDLESALIGAYDRVQSLYSGPLYQYAEAISDNVDLISQRNDGMVRAYNWQLGLLAGSIWSTSYQAINNANKIIEVVYSGTINDGDFPIYRERILAEAYFIRAVMHFELVRLYAKQYATDAGDVRGIVLKTLPTNGRDKYVSSSVKRIYDQIKYDLKLAMGGTDTTRPEGVRIKAELPAVYSGATQYAAYAGSNYGRPLLSAAQAMYARVCFQQGTLESYAEAKNYVDLVIPAEGAIVNYGNYLEEDPGRPFDMSGFGGVSKEIVWWVLNEIGDNSATTLHEIFAYNWPSPGPIFGGSLYGDTSSSYLNEGSGLVTLFTKTIKKTDKRSMYTTNSNVAGVLWNPRTGGGTTTVVGFHNKKWKPAQQNTNNIQNVPIIRYAELILMRAEIKAILGDLEGAAADVEALREYRYTQDGINLNDHLVPADVRADKVKLVKYIRMERRIEMAFEGNRIHDIRRCWNDPVLLGTPAPVIAKVDRANQTNKTWDDITLLLEFPDAEVIANPDVETCCDCGGNPGNCKPQ